MKTLKNLVVALLLTVWVGSTVAQAAVPATDTRRPAAPVEPAPPAPTALSSSALLALGSTQGQATSENDQEAAALSAREEGAPGLRDYRGGGRYVYIGSGATLIIVLILLIILL